MKVVINDCYGGFSLSPEGEQAYLERKGETPFFYVNRRFDEGGRVDFDKMERWRPDMEGFVVVYTYLEDLGDFPDNKHERESARYFSAREIERNDPDLVAVVEELGEKADGRHAKLKVVEIPDDVEWEIDEYDGLEHIAETHRVWR